MVIIKGLCHKFLNLITALHGTDSTSVLFGEKEYLYIYITVMHVYGTDKGSIYCFLNRTYRSLNVTGYIIL